MNRVKRNAVNWQPSRARQSSTMSARMRYIVLIIAVQTLCVALGVWIHSRFITSSVTTTVLERAWDELDASFESAAAEFSRLGEAEWPIETSPLEAFRKHLAASMLPKDGAIVYVDRDWRVLAGHAAGSASSSPLPPKGQRLSFRSLGKSNSKQVTPGRGRLELTHGPQIAVVRPVGREGGRLVAYRPLNPIHAEARELVASVPAAAMITVVWTAGLVGIAVYMIVSHLHDRLASERGRVQVEAMRRMDALVRTRDAVIFGLAKLADSRDPETGEHLERLSIYATTLATAASRHVKFGEHVTPAFIRLIGISSALHDIGKVGIEDDILLKPGPLTADERKRMQRHTIIGGECLREIERRLGTSNFLQMAREIAYSHHEWWDGTGYPYGVSGESIPLAGRIVAIADVYDALSARRVYKEPFPHQKCVDIIRNGAGTQFDPELVEVWLTVERQFGEIAKRYSVTAPLPAGEVKPPRKDVPRPTPEAKAEPEPEPMLAGSTEE